MENEDVLDPPPPYEETTAQGRNDNNTHSEQTQRPTLIRTSSAGRIYRIPTAHSETQPQLFQTNTKVEPQSPNAEGSRGTTAQDAARPSSSPTSPSPSPQQYLSPTAAQALGGSSTTIARGTVARQFPASFSLYSDGKTSTYILGEHRDKQLYAVRLHTTLPVRQGEQCHEHQRQQQAPSTVAVLHNGQDPDRCAVLAAADLSHSSTGGDITVTLPPLRPGSRVAGSQVTIQCDDRGRHRSYSFCIQVGLIIAAGEAAETEQRLESFEWRHSYGAAVEVLSSDFDGWKLVRREEGAPPGHPDPGSFCPTSGYTTSDGFEVVAAWSDARVSRSKQAKFAFVGTGLTGILGERWAVMAVMSALAIWERERRRRKWRLM